MTELPGAAEEYRGRPLTGTRYKVKSLGRALDLLDVLAGLRPTPFSRPIWRAA
jgi:hypothetical protein